MPILIPRSSPTGPAEGRPEDRLRERLEGWAASPFNQGSVVRARAASARGRPQVTGWVGGAPRLTSVP